MLNYISDLYIPGAYLDVGANIGNHSVYFAMNTAASEVFSIEPSPVSAELCRQFAFANGLEGEIEVIEVAAGPRAGSVDIEYYVSEGNFAETSVRQAPLDSLISRPISLIKMDIEGAELGALQGASRILSQDKPRLFIEAHQDDDYLPICDYLAGFGYTPTGRVFNSSPTYEFST
jgi:FkbM family methyltransferase